MQELNEIRDLYFEMFPEEIEKKFGNDTEKTLLKALKENYELTILDILIMLPKQGLETRITAHYIYFDYKGIKFSLYLKKPLIQDQPEESIIQLNKLICN